MPERIYQQKTYYDKLITMMSLLRQQCPWDQEQTLLSLRQYTLEEAHEVIEAVELADAADDWEPLKKELGDLLIQVLFYAQLADEADQFNLADVIDALIEKMIYRHPHVFEVVASDDKSSTKLQKLDEINDQWDRLKDKEQTQRKSLMDDIPPLPALKYAQKQQQRAARVAFDWTNTTDVMKKMREELDELEHELIKQHDIRRIEDEFGDVLFTLANLARKLDIDAELCLMQSNRKFATRFRGMEKTAENRGTSLADMSLAEMESLYQDVKTQKNEVK